MKGPTQQSISVLERRVRAISFPDARVVLERCPQGEVIELFNMLIAQQSNMGRIFMYKALFCIFVMKGTCAISCSRFFSTDTFVYSLDNCHIGATFVYSVTTAILVLLNKIILIRSFCQIHQYGRHLLCCLVPQELTKIALYTLV